MILRRIRKTNEISIRSHVVAATMAAAFGATAFAADLLPQSRIDASGTGTVPVAAPMKSGFSKFTLHGESSPYGAGADALPSQSGLDRSNRFDALAGTSIVKGIDLHLGIHGTYEREGAVASRRVSAGSLMIKTNLISSSGFNLALAPYLESGIGTKGKEVETRAVRARGGVMLLTGWNRKNVFEWNLALGNRNRATEEFENLAFGHESVYKTSVKVNLTNSFGLTAAADGRQIRVRRDGSSEESIFGAGRGQAGFFARFGGVETSVYGGASIDRALGKKLWKPKHEIADLDGGRLFFGAAVSMSIGGGQSRDEEPARDLENQFDKNAVEYQTRNRSKAPSVKESPVKASPDTNKTGASEPASYDNDFLKDFNGYSNRVNSGDDFSATEHAIKNRNLNQPQQQGGYDINAVEREIAALREAEKKAEEARRQAEEVRMEKERTQRAKSKAEHAAELRRMHKEVKAEVDALPTITTEDMSWRGLE